MLYFVVLTIFNFYKPEYKSYIVDISMDYFLWSNPLYTTPFQFLQILLALAKLSKPDINTVLLPCWIFKKHFHCNQFPINCCSNAFYRKPTTNHSFQFSQRTIILTHFFPLSRLLTLFFFVTGEHPAAMQHGGQLRLEYPFSAVLLSILVAVAGP